jgi:hypothetical protein
VATKQPDREVWEIHDSSGFRGPVIRTAASFHTVKLFGNEFDSVGTFVTLEAAAKATRHETELQPPP